MMIIPIMDGITAQTIATDRLTTRVLFSGPDDGVPVLFLHGNISSATWWEETMVALPDGYRGIAPDQRGFGGADFDKKVDATRGAGDWADDAIALLDHLGIEKAHIVGNSLGGNVVWQLLVDAPERFLSATLVDPGSPYGFGGTKDEDGTPCYDDFAGSGGGLSNPELIRRMKEGDMSLDSPVSPRAALRMLLVRPPFIAAREDELVMAMLAAHVGEQDVPGDSAPSPNWPHMAPGKWGATNALSPKYAIDVNDLYAAEPKTKVLWIRGSHDLAVSDNAASDPATVGAMGLLPGYPGPEVYPAQPMLKQTRAVLEKYAANGGAYQEVVIEDAGHIPYVEKPDEFNKHFHEHIN
ncbi:MAG: alpha/beta hydrolase [Ardenticatenaceae bacterium]|nr:alpha/beta hydrolase [Ardenticatenaceae bacterium]